MGSIGLFFVGITLIINGCSTIYKLDKKSVGVFNLMTGILSSTIHILYLINGDYYAAGSGFLFAFTYVMVGIFFILDLDFQVYGIFALFVAINTIPFATISFIHHDYIFAIIWLLWGILWFFGFLENNLKKSFGNKVAYFAIFCGIFTTWLPGLVQLIQAS